jgi:transcriptional regulator, DeoR family
MAEASKLGRRIPNLELPWERVDVLITDERLPAEAARAIETRGVQVICAPVDN